MRTLGSIDADTTGPRKSRPDSLYVNPPSRFADCSTFSIVPVICSVPSTKICTSAPSTNTSLYANGEFVENTKSNAAVGVRKS